MVNEVDLFQLNVHVLLQRINFLGGGRSVENGEVTLFRLRNLSLFRELAYKSYHSNSIIGGIFKIVSKVMSYATWFVKMETQGLTLYLESLFKRWGRGVRPIIGRISMIILQLALVVRRKHFKHFSIFYFLSLILETKDLALSQSYFKNLHFVTSLN